MILLLDSLPPLPAVVIHRRFATRSLRELKRLEGITKSPVYARFSSDMAGTYIALSNINEEDRRLLGHYIHATYTTPLKVSSPYARIKPRECCSLFTKTPPRGSGGSLVCGCSFGGEKSQTRLQFRRRLTSFPVFYVFQATAGLDLDSTLWPHMS